MHTWGRVDWTEVILKPHLLSPSWALHSLVDVEKSKASKWMSAPAHPSLTHKISYCQFSWKSGVWIYATYVTQNPQARIVSESVPGWQCPLVVRRRKYKSSSKVFSDLPNSKKQNPLQYSCLENPMDRGAWWAAVHGVAKSRTRLSDFTFTFMHWRRKWQPTPVFLPGESQGRGSLVGCRLWGRTESDMTEAN